MFFRHWLFCLTAVLSWLDVTLGFFEPLTIITVGAAVVGSYLFRNQIGRILGYYEGCEDKWIPENLHGLESDLLNNVFGQRLAVGSILSTLKIHYRNRHSEKPLVLSFHGMPGTGKNFIADFIAANMFKMGRNSQYVHFYSAYKDFPFASERYVYKIKLESDITESIKMCQRSIVIFDEIEKFPDGLLEFLSQFASGRKNIENINYRKVIFILLSNTAQLYIRDVVDTQHKLGKHREELSMHHFKNLTNAVYKDRGGLRGTTLIAHDLIDNYIPFLPMETDQVIKCVIHEIKRINQTVSSNLISEVLDRLNFEGRFSTSGCKRVTQVVMSEVMNQVIKLREQDL